ncbi:anticodon-binding aminoacyl-tRNA synthetase, class 1a, partial [Tanacetum coccineum]
MKLVIGESDRQLGPSHQQLQQREDKRWIFKDEVSKVFDDSIKASFSELEEEEEAEIMTCPKGVPDDYICLNVLSIWPQLRKRYSGNKEPRHIGKAIRKNLPKSAKDMIKQCSVRGIGYVTFSLSRKWMAQSIHKMIKDGIDTWAPKLPVERVIVDFPSLDEEDIHVGLLRRRAIRYTLIRMLKYSKVAVLSKGKFGCRDFQGHDILKRWFSIKEIQGDEGNVVIDTKGILPFILAKRDLIHLCKDLEALRNVIRGKKPDWIVYVTPVRQQEYIEACFTAAKLEKWIQSDMEGKWDPSQKNEYPVLTYVGYRSCGTKQDGLTNLLDEVKTRCVEVAEGMAAKLLGYNAEEVLDCVLAYTFLKTRRLDDCTFSEMVNEEENTFVYLLNRRAEIRRIIENSREDIDELKKASQLILEDGEECGKGEERMLEFQLLEFSGALEESCLFVIPHILCEYLYQLSKKFTSYYSSVYKVGSVAKRSTLLLCEATAVVMDKCFHLLGITP